MGLVTILILFFIGGGVIGLSEFVNKEKPEWWEMLFELDINGNGKPGA